MNVVQKKLKDLEKLKKDISAKLDKYEFNFDKEKEKIDMLDLNLKRENDNNKSNNILGKNYKEIMNKRLDDIMGKIDDNIINKNYSDLYKFLLSASPYKKIKQEKLKQNKEKEIEENAQIIKESISRNNNNNKNNNQIIQSTNEINKSISEHIEKEELTSQKEKEKENQNELKNDLREIIQDRNNNNNNKKEKNIIVEYDGSGKVDFEELKSKQNSELLQKQQNIYLSNELLTLKNKLNNLRKDNEFLKSVINEKGMVKNTNVLEKFIGKFVERLSLNWDEIVENIIDELLLDETYILNEIDLKKINYEKNKNILIKNLIKAGCGGILPEAEDNPNTNIDLIFDNIDFIKKVLNNVKQNEKDMKIKYNIEKYRHILISYILLRFGDNLINFPFERKRIFYIYFKIIYKTIKLIIN